MGSRRWALGVARAPRQTPFRTSGMPRGNCSTAIVGKLTPVRRRVTTLIRIGQRAARLGRPQGSASRCRLGAGLDPKKCRRPAASPATRASSRAWNTSARTEPSERKNTRFVRGRGPKPGSCCRRSRDRPMATGGESRPPMPRHRAELAPLAMRPSMRSRSLSRIFLATSRGLRPIPPTKPSERAIRYTDEPIRHTDKLVRYTGQARQIHGQARQTHGVRRQIHRRARQIHAARHHQGAAPCPPGSKGLSLGFHTQERQAISWTTRC